MTRRHQVAIVGMGLAGLSTAARLTELGVENVALYACGSGGSPHIEAINFVCRDNPAGDTPERYSADILRAGCSLGDPDRIRQLAARSEDCLALLRRWGAAFSLDGAGAPQFRQVPGNTCPRALYRTDVPVGAAMLKAMRPKLEQAGVQMFPKCRILDLLTSEGAVDGFLVQEGERVYPVYAPVVVAAWGGMGGLLGCSTYPADVRGNTLGMAKLAGAAMVDMEFLDFEPMVLLNPPGDYEPVPIRLLREGGHLCNAAGARILTDEQEAKVSKAEIAQQIWRQAAAGQGGPHRGALLDLREVRRETLDGCPWLLHCLARHGIDPHKDLLEVGPIPHSFLGGIKVDSGYRSTVEGLYAAGEACGGIHGAARCAGNAGSQAAVSGLLCAESIAGSARLDRKVNAHPAEAPQSQSVRDALLPGIQRSTLEALGVYRDEKTLEAACAAVDRALHDPRIEEDLFTRQSAVAMKLMLRSARMRRESRGVHNRLDYPICDSAFNKEIDA